MFNFKHVYVFLLLVFFGFNLKQLRAGSRVFYPDNIVMTGKNECSFVKDLEKDQRIFSSATTFLDNSEKSKINKINVGKISFSKSALIELKSPDGLIGSLVVSDKVRVCKQGSFLKKELGIKEKENIFFVKNWVRVSNLKVGDKIKGFSDEILMVNKINFFDADKDGCFYELDVYGDFYLVDSVGHKVLSFYLSTSDNVFIGAFVLAPFLSVFIALILEISSN